MLSRETVAVAEKWPGARDVRPCEVRIGRTVYEGFRYTVPPEWEGSRVGEHRFYLLSDAIPASHGRAVYRIEGDNADWYFGGYVTPESARDERYASFHPLGAHFLLMRWDHEHLGERVDRFREVPYRRMRIDVTYA